MYSSNLTVLITTYNHAIFVDNILQTFFDYLKRGLVFSILISDDHSSDNTYEIYQKWAKQIKNLEYYSHDQNMGMDENFKTAYTHCRTKYCWLLGDHRMISYEEMKNLLNEIDQEKYDAWILKTRSENNFPTKVYTDVNVLLREIGYNITNNASCIIPTSYFQLCNYKRYMGTTFLHMGIFIDNLCLKDNFKVKYLSNVYVKNIDLPGRGGTGWGAHPFLNFGIWWYQFVMSLPNEVTLKTKEYVLTEHNKITNLFSYKNVLRHMLSSDRHVYKSSYLKCRKYFKFIEYRPVIFYDFVICCIPEFIYLILYNIIQKVRNSHKGE